MSGTDKSLTVNQQMELLDSLHKRLEENMHRHGNLKWSEVETRLKTHVDSLWSLFEMERTGGEPDVVGCDVRTGEYTFYDCAPESPEGRRSIC